MDEDSEHTSPAVRLGRAVEDYAHELAEVDGALAHVQAALEALREGREPVTSDEQLGTGAGAAWNLGEVALGAFVVVAAAAQVQLTQVALQGVFSSATSLRVALGYVVGLVVAAGAIGRWLALGRARSRSAAMSLLASPLALLCAAAVMMATLATRGLRATDLVGNAVSTSVGASVGDRIVADGVLTAVQLLFVVVSVAFGYQVAGRGKRRELLRGEAVRERQPVLRERRRALLREYVARGMSLRAEARRVDALYLHETLQRAPELGDVLAETLEDLLPRWMRDACDELDAREAETSGSASAVTARVPL